MRVSKGAGAVGSNHSSPPTPQDEQEGNGSGTRPKSSLGLGSPVMSLNPSSPILAAAAARRASLSRSESYPIITGTEQQRPQSQVSALPSSRPRSFQRVVSGPALSSAPSSASAGAGSVVSSSSSSSSSLNAGANGLRATSRKLSVRPTSAIGTTTTTASATTSGSVGAGPQRVTIEQYLEMDEKIRMEDEEMRALVRDDGGDATDVEGPGDLNVHHHTNTHRQHHQHRTSGLSPRLLQAVRSASTSQIPPSASGTAVANEIQYTRERVTSGLPSRASSSTISASTTSNPPTAAASSTQTSTVNGRQIFPGPNRAGRILMGAKYPSSASAPSSAAAAGGFGRISEVESDSDVGPGGVLDYYTGDDEFGM